MSKKSAVELWSELKAWYEVHLPEALESLNPGASEEAIATFETELRQEIGQGLPEGLRDIYLQNDGQDWLTTTCGMFFGLAFLSLDEMLRNWQSWRDIAKDTILELDEDFRELGTIHPPDTIQNFYAHPSWLPFTHDGGGNHLGIDLQPGPSGRVGQVINFGADENNRRVIAPSLEAFLEWMLEQYASNNYNIATYDIDGRKERHLQTLMPDTEGFLDAVPILFPPDQAPPQAVFSSFTHAALVAASRATKVVQEGASGDLEIRTKRSPKDLVTQVDLASERVIREVILEHFPEHGILGEEGGLVGESPYRWIIDPIDGTSNFARGVPHYAVSIGLEHDGKGLVGVIAQPVLNDLYHAERGVGSFKDGYPIRVSLCTALSDAYVTMSFSTDTAVVTRATALWDTLLLRAHTLRRLGSTAVELAWLAEGKIDAFVGFGQGAWDIAAGRVLVEEAGGSVVLLDGGATCIAASSATLAQEIGALLETV